MKTLIEIYLLLKSAFGWPMIRLDSEIAMAIVKVDRLAPEWLTMVANMEQETPLPEAFQHFMLGVEAWVAEWME